MLVRSTTLAPSASTTAVSGQFLAKNRLSKRERARLALDILNHRVEIKALTVRQAASLCRVSVGAVKNERTPRSDLLVKAWADATSDQRAEFVRRADPRRVFEVIEQVI